MLLLVSFAGNTEPDKKVVIGLVIFPPLVLQQSFDGACSGPAVDISKAIFTEYGYAVETYCAPAARLYTLFQEGKVDVTINVNSTSAIKQHVDFHDVPFARLRVALLTNKELESDKTVSAIRGFDYHGVRDKLIADEMIFVDLPNGNDAVNVFLRKRTSALLTYMRPYRYLIAKSSFDIPEKIQLEEMLELETYYGVSKASPWHNDIFKVLDSYTKENNIVRFSGVETLP